MATGGVKMRLYARHGVPRYWIVDADAQTLEVYALRGDAYERTATYRDGDHAYFDVPAGFEMNLADAWSEE